MRCPLCPNINKCLPESGPIDADVLFIGEAPGAQENKRGTVFIGRAGEEVNRHYLPLAGLTRSTVRITNAIRCLPSSAGGKLDPKKRRDQALLQSCTETFLYPSLTAQPPRVIVPMGAFACQAICGATFNLELEHGIPYETAWGWAFPMYHPALGLYEPKKMLLLRNDWMRLKLFLKGTLELPEDPYPTPDYREVRHADEVDDLDPSRPLAVDTESSKRGPFCLTYSQSAGTGRLIQSTSLRVLAALNARLQDWQAPILFHNWLYDWAVTEAMGLQFPHRAIVDTMAEVYRLGNLPQGLKALARRELGMTMQDFMDVVAPYSRERVLDYLHQAAALTWTKPEANLVLDESTGLWKVYAPQSLNTKLKRFFTDYGTDPEKDVFLAWDNWADAHAMVEAELGPFPGICISHVPFDEVVFYACRDADVLIRLWPIIRRMQARVRKFPQQEWRVS